MGLDIFVEVAKFLRFKAKKKASLAKFKSNAYIRRSVMKSSVNFLRGLTGIKTQKNVK